MSEEQALAALEWFQYQEKRMRLDVDNDPNELPIAYPHYLLALEALTQAAEIERGDKVVVDGWKPIESAPEGIALLTYEFDADIGDAIEIATYAFDGVWDCRGYVRGQYKPTHWMLLPQPPKEQNHE